MTFSSPSSGHTDKTIWKLGGLTFWGLLVAVVHDIEKDEIFERASGLAFDFLLALFPLLFILLAAFSLFSSHSLELQSSLLAYFADLLPASAFQLLNTTAEQLAATQRGEKLAVGIFVGIWLISGGVASIISSLNMAFRVKESRGWFKVRAIAIVLTVVISILILAALGIVLISGDFVDWFGRELHLTSAVIVLWKALQWPTAMLFVIFSYALIYTFGPNLPERRWHWITPGSIFATTLWLVASTGFRIYLEYVNNYSIIFGSLGALVILMVWLYVTGVAFLIGGEINANIERAVEQDLVE